MHILSAFVLLCVLGYVRATGRPSSTDSLDSRAEAGYCGCDVDPAAGVPIGWKTTDIWVDVVIILDNSEAMGEQSLTKAIDLINSLIGNDFSDVLITDVSAVFYTRIGLITASNTAEVLYSLNMTKFDKLDGKVQIKKGIAQVNVETAFVAANNIFHSEERRDRENTRRVIYYMTDSEPYGNLQDVNQFKAMLGTVIVNNFIKEETSARPGLRDLASDGYYSTNIQTNYLDTVQLFCKANCFCPPVMYAYRGSSSDPAVKVAGGCFIPNPDGIPWSRANSLCAELGSGGLLVSIHDDDKAQFAKKLLDFIPTAHYFWFGYSKSDDGIWRWEDKSTNAYTNWNTDEPSPVAVSRCAYADKSTDNIYWGAANCQVGFPSVCEYPPCMAGNKC